MNPLAASRRAAKEQPKNRLRVLVVDDELRYAEAISMLVGEHEGMEVVGIAGDGHEAIELACYLQPDVVLMDVQMPRLDGISATRWIHRNLPATNVVVMTALTAEEHAEGSFSAGGVAFVKKFSSARELVAAIEQFS
ncbi:MAG: response regulator transcription factor [Actinomycetota bacterium]